jgi:formamidopyrimidine-DNA glycosylase
MPELPEVEVTRLSISERLTGAVIREVWLGKPLRFALDCAPARLAGLQVLEVTRRSKYLLARTASGTLILHLGMSGSLAWAAPGAPRGLWIRFELHTDKGVLQLDDPRRFGAAVWHEGAGVEQHRLLRHLGAEPLLPGFDGSVLHAHSRSRSVSVKEFLLAGKAVVGVGNIYASEALFRAKIDPRLPAGKLTRPKCARLADEIKAVLSAAILQGGSTLRDFSNAEGQQGYFQMDANVYGREGAPCKTCGNPIARITQGQRSTFFCATCQKR